MSRTHLNFILDVTLALAFVALCFVTVILAYVFPRGATAEGWRLWGLAYDDWARAQFALVGVLALGILVHVMLHWNWVCGVIASRLGRKGRVDDGVQTLYGVALLIVILGALGVALAAAKIMVQSPH